MDYLKQAAIDAIDELFGDTSVSEEETLDALEEVAEIIGDKITALREQLKGT